MLAASASIQGTLSIGCPHGNFRSTFKIYERALVIACPILVPFAHHCGISVRTRCDVPITRKPQVADPELRLALLEKVACGSDFRLRQIVRLVCRKPCAAKLPTACEIFALINVNESQTHHK
jgi:hypothetical protein